MRRIWIAGALFAAVIDGPAAASEIPRGVLRAEHQKCVASASRKNPAVDRRIIDQYCECSMDQIARRFDYASYLEVDRAMTAGRDHARAAELGQITLYCTRLVTQ